ncbi:uncharacterized protein LOC105201798 isoform X2 [Solenopsis invicta]|uniref:uncharacterized protein LOC105201798 isoform X2 n=1 Tax=Solenopsis invicta TaxID=13686 RepID=UPI00193D094A|nr:uncharacterized protein LOC105201798 isoform X2 [Solenopsis invicta]
MPTRRRSIIVRSFARYLFAVCIAVSLSTSLTKVEGRKCVCTSKACIEARIDTCRTRFFCYTELIATTGQEIGESTITRGCTEGATPLLCETKSWVMRSRSLNVVELSASPRRRRPVHVPWPRLICCNSHDYCNAAGGDDDDDDDDDDVNAWTRERKEDGINEMRSTMDRETPMIGPTTLSTNRDTTLMLQPDRKHRDPTESANQLLRNRIRTLHIAALVLSVAALMSILASCYVVTRFLQSNRYTMDAVNVIRQDESKTYC